MKKRSLLILWFLLFSLVQIPEAKADEGATEVNIIAHDDGYYQKTPVPAYTKANNTDTITIDFDAGIHWRRGFMLFNITTIPDTATITGVSLLYSGRQHVTDCNITGIVLNPNSDPIEAVYNAIGNGTLYASPAGFPVDADNQEVVLADDPTDQVALNLTASLAGTWFSLGITQFDETVDPGGQTHIWGAQNLTAAPRPTLKVSYFMSPFTYQFSDTYYENGTLYIPPVNVTASGDGFTDEFNTSGGTTEYYALAPETFIWDIGSGFSRFIYGIGVDENLTITYPDGTDYTYSFTIKDLTGNIGTDSFLEAYRTINGTETLISRMPIEQPNPVPMNLVFGRTYRMKIRFGDGSTFDWGFLIPGSDTTITLLIRFVTFSDGAQVLYNHITVDAVRTTGLITMDYLDDRNNTIWANVSIRIRNGAVVQTYTRSNASYTISYIGFNDSLGYIVAFTGYHSDFGTWGRTFILDQSFTFPDPPELDGVFGPVMVNFIPFMLTCITILVFPVSMQPIGLLGGGIMATMMSFIGWASWSADLLYFYWFIAILVNLVVRGRNS